MYQNKKILNWNYKISLKEDFTKAYNWINTEITNTNNESNFRRFTK